MIISIDTLGGVKYPEVIAKLPKRYGTGYFWSEFGLARDQIAKDAASRLYIRVQGIWAKHEFNSSHELKAIQIGKELQKIAARNPACLIEYSPYCEHRKDARYMVTLLNKIQLHCPKVALVNSPVRGGEWVRGFKNEIHHNDKPAGMPEGRFNFSMDGLHQVDSDIEKHKKYLNNVLCDAWFCWVLQDNCKPNTKPENNKPPKQRTHKPSVDLHNSMLFQVENAKAQVSLPKGWLYKSHAEEEKDPNPRANKPVVITPKGKRFKKMLLGGVELRESGSFDGRQVWRCSQWGFKIGRKLEIKADGKLIGTVDGGWRENEWREKT